MKSAEHAVLGAVTSAILVFVLPEVAGSYALVLFAYGVLVSVFIDLDHFVLARYHAGDWSHLRRCLTDPVFAFTQQEQVFEGVETRTLEVHRLLSHVVVGGVLVGSLAAFDTTHAHFTAGVLYVHVVADLLRDGDVA